MPTTKGPHRLRRLAPLSALVFGVLVVLGGPFMLGSTPSANASGTSVIAFYTAHRAREHAGSIVLAFAFAFFLAFVGSLADHLRRAASPSGLSALVLAAGTLFVAGQTTNFGVAFALSDAPAQLSPGAAQALNALANDLVLTSSVGGLAFGISAGLAILAGALLPRWIGWAAIAFGVLFVTPAEVVGAAGLLIWTLIVSFLVYRASTAQTPQLA
jgi:uncharacterized membrane-anchored protein YitT (DUF2179 family)